MGKLVRRLLDGLEGDDGRPMTWASSHTFRRTLVTGMHLDSVPHALIADATGHDDLRVLQEHYVARMRVSTLAADRLADPVMPKL